MISCLRRSKVSFTPSFKSLPKLVTLTPPRARTNISYMCPPGKETVEIANANYEKAKLTPPPPPIKQNGYGNHIKPIHLPIEPTMLKL